jgi:hypothetical protein
MAKHAAFPAPVVVQLRQRGGDEPSSKIIASARRRDWRFVPKRQSRRFRPRDEAGHEYHIAVAHGQQGEASPAPRLQEAHD